MRVTLPSVLDADFQQPLPRRGAGFSRRGDRHAAVHRLHARVVDARSFSGAAKLLGTTKSAVSKQVARLEQQLGTRLLHRTTRSISPTAEGRGVYERAQRLLEEAQALDAELDPPQPGLALLATGAPCDEVVEMLAFVLAPESFRVIEDFTIEDDGVGFPVDLEISRGIGNVRRRAERLGGSMTVTEAKSGGTVVVWQVPMPVGEE